MFDFSSSLFGSAASIPPSAKIVFVADYFSDELIGGAELTSQALIDASPFEVAKVKSKSLTPQLIQDNTDKFWIFGNIAEINPQLIPNIVGNVRYSVLEYDYKYCKARSPEKHAEITKSACDCHNDVTGKVISAFFYGSCHLWWMSEKQKERYMMMFPFLGDRDNTVLSSVFDLRTLLTLKQLREASASVERKGWIVLDSQSWIKGTEAAKAWCERTGKDYELVGGIGYEAFLKKLSTAEGLVYLPPGGDTCPRMVIEAKLLGCKLQLNENVQHKDEEWFATDDLTSIEEYLTTATKTFWTGIKAAMDYRPAISGYITTYNCRSQGYPFIQCIQSMLEFCDEVNVADSGSTDDTFDALMAFVYPGATVSDIEDFRVFGLSSGGLVDFPETLTSGAKKDARINVRIVNGIDWSAKNSAVYDGKMKAIAREMCTKDFCWQMDSDEIVHEDDAKKILELCRALPKELDVISLPVLEYWGGPDKVRIDIQPWKWRLSRNSQDITHGIPADMRRKSPEGLDIAAEGTDGCDMISKATGERLPHVSFYTQDIENLRNIAAMGSSDALAQYESWLNAASSHLPTVFHYSWYDLERKIKLYRSFWTRHWNSLYGKSIDDTAENNMMFDVPWSEVTDEMIKDLAVRLQATGGHIWHSKWKGQITPWMKSSRTQPKWMRKS